VLHGQEVKENVFDAADSDRAFRLVSVNDPHAVDGMLSQFLDGIANGVVRGDRDRGARSHLAVLKVLLQVNDEVLDSLIDSPEESHIRRDGFQINQ